MRRRLLSIVGALGLMTGLLSSGVAAQADNSMSDSNFQSMVNFYTAVASYGGTFCYAQPSSTTACPNLTQNTTGHNNFAICVENSTATPTANEACSIIQTGTGHNIAIIIQLIRQNGAAAETGTQDGAIDQTTGTGSNLAATVQVIRQQFGNRDEDPTQNDRQDSSTYQTSTSGHNFKFLAQSSQQDAQSTPSVGGTQNSSEHGNINQSSTGVSKALAFQNQHQGLTGGGPQHQSIDPRCCSTQGTNTSNVFQITQRADQHGDGTPVQNSSTIGECDSTGQCTIDQTATSNAGSHHNHTICTPGVFCATGIVCTAAACTPCTPSEGGCSTVGLAPIARPSGYGMVAVRGSVFASSRSASGYAGVARSAPGAALLT